MSATFALYPEAEPTDYVFIALLSVTATLVVIGFMAFIFNEVDVPALGPCHVVDNARWTAMVVFALQFYDFGLHSLSIQS